LKRGNEIETLSGRFLDDQGLGYQGMRLKIDGENEYELRIRHFINVLECQRLRFNEPLTVFLSRNSIEKRSNLIHSKLGFFNR
jgi:hypothetical protein